MKPTWTSGLPAARSASTTCSEDAASMVSGFSHNVYLPASMQASSCSGCTKPGEAISTASTRSSRISSSGSA